MNTITNFGFHIMEIILSPVGLGTVPNGFNFVINYFHRCNWGRGVKKGKCPHPSIFLPKDIFFDC